MLKLKMTLFRYGTMLFGKILEQDKELLVNKKEFPEGKEVFEYNGIKIVSHAGPDIVKNTLFIRGSDRKRNNVPFSAYFPTAEEADIMARKIKKTIENFNKHRIYSKSSESIVVGTDSGLKVLLGRNNNYVSAKVLCQNVRGRRLIMTDDFWIDSTDRVGIGSDGLFVRGSGTRFDNATAEAGFYSRDYSIAWIKRCKDAVHKYNGVCAEEEDCSVSLEKDFWRYL